MNVDEFIILSQEDVEKLSGEWKEEKDGRWAIRESNRNGYYTQRDDLLKKFKGKHIAFSNGKVVGVSDTFDGITPYIDEDPCVFTTRVGYEGQKPSIDDILVFGQ